MLWRVKSDLEFASSNRWGFSPLLAAHQLYKNDVVTVHRKSDFNIAAGIAPHNFIRLRKILREFIQMRDLRFSQLFGRTEFDVGGIGIIGMKPRAMQFKVI